MDSGTSVLLSNTTFNISASGMSNVKPLRFNYYQNLDNSYAISINSKNKKLAESILSTILLNDKELTLEESIKLTQDINDLKKEIV